MLPVEQPFKTYTGLDGRALDNGYIWFGQPNQNPQTKPVTVYWDAAGTIPAAQPLRTMNGYVLRGGTPANVFFDGAYSELVWDSKRRQVFYARTSDEFSIATVVSTFLADISGPNGAARIGFKQRGNGTVLRNLKDKASDLVTIKDFGGVGDGSTDDTAAVLKAAASGLDIYLEADYIIKDAMVELKNGQTWYGPGSVRQVQGSRSASPDKPNAYYPASDYPVFKLNSAGATLSGVKVYPLLGEGVQMFAPRTKVLNCVVDGEGRTWYDGILPYADDVQILGNDVYDVGPWLAGTAYAQRGDAIFLSGAPWRRARVGNNYCQGGAKNGIFVNGFKDSNISDNICVGNRMSMVQLAFLPGLYPSGLTISGNVGIYNGADMFDCNNSSGMPISDINMNTIVSGNFGGGNGWVYDTREHQLTRESGRQETNDGGTATLINIAGLRYINNTSHNNRRCAAYIAGCADIEYAGNRVFKDSSAAEDDTDGIRIESSIRIKISDNSISVPGAVLRVQGTCTRTTVFDNAFERLGVGDAIVVPSGMTGLSFRRNKVYLVNGTFILNPIFEFEGCDFVASVNGYLTVAGVNGLTYRDNTYDIGASGSIVFSGCTDLIISGGGVKANTNSGNGAMQINSLLGAWSMAEFRVTQTGPTAAILFAGAASTGTITMRDTYVTGNAAGNSIKVNPDVTAALVIRQDGYANKSGFADYGAATKQSLTWV